MSLEAVYGSSFGSMYHSSLLGKQALAVFSSKDLIPIELCVGEGKILVNLLG